MSSAVSVPSLDIFERPEYWDGEIGYRPPGYTDFPINSVKEAIVVFHRPASVLDLGCAYGFSVARLRQVHIPAWGVDCSSLALSRAPKEAAPYLYHAPLWAIPLPDQSIDFGFSSGVLEHIPENKLMDTIKEITRVCRRGLAGIAVTDDPTSAVNEDDSHEALRSLHEWAVLFPKSWKVISDSQQAWRYELAVKLYQEVVCKR